MWEFLFNQRPESYNAFGIEEGSKHYAADTMAALTRARWQDTRGMLQPLTTRMQYDYFNPMGRQELMQRSAQSAGLGLDQARTQLNERIQSTGMSLAPDQRAAIDSSFAQAKNVSLIDAKNRASRGYDEVRNSLATGI